MRFGLVSKVGLVVGVLSAGLFGCGDGDSTSNSGVGATNPQMMSSDMGGASGGQGMPVSAQGMTAPANPPATAATPQTPPAANPNNGNTAVMAPMVCTETCRYSGDGECDDGGPNYWTSACAYGTDCMDCGPRIEGPTTACTESYSRGQDCWMLEDCQAYGNCELSCVAQCQQGCSNGVKCANLSACVEECGGNEGCESRCLERYPACWACDRACERDCASECGADHGQCKDCLDGFADAESTCESCNREAFVACYRNWCNAALDSLFSCQAVNGCDDLSWTASNENCTTTNCGTERDAFFDCIERNGEEIERRFDALCGPRWDQCTVVPGAVRASMPPAPQMETQPEAPVAPARDADGNVCEESCFTAGDGECDDGGPEALYSICFYGSDCADCGIRGPATGVCAEPTMRVRTNVGRAHRWNASSVTGMPTKGATGTGAAPLLRRWARV